MDTQPDRNELHTAVYEIRLLLVVAARMSREALETRLSAQGVDLTGLQFAILNTLRREELTLSELSKRMMLDPSTLVPVIDSVERKGYAQRTKDPNDRRRTPITLTAAGGKLLAEIGKIAHDDDMSRSLSNLGDERVKLLRGLLRDLIRAMPDGERIVEDVQESIRQA